jgi:hypothetical protein
MFPTFIAIGIIIIVAGYFFPHIWRHIRRYEQNTDAFNADFANIEYQKYRTNFAWHLEKAYRKYNSGNSKKSLRDLLNNIKFPDTFPPSKDKSIIDYAIELDSHWSNNDLWKFFKALFKDMLEPEQAEYLTDVEYREFLEGRRITSKFWDDVARQIIKGQLKYEDIKRPTDANILSIKALALAELAVAYEFTWDLGPGKTPLFVLALDPRNLLEYRNRL